MKTEPPPGYLTIDGRLWAVVFLDASFKLAEQSLCDPMPCRRIEPVAWGVVVQDILTGELRTFTDRDPGPLSNLSVVCESNGADPGPT